MLQNLSKTLEPGKIASFHKTTVFVKIDVLQVLRNVYIYMITTLYLTYFLEIQYLIRNLMIDHSGFLYEFDSQ